MNGTCSPHKNLLVSIGKSWQQRQRHATSDQPHPKEGRAEVLCGHIEWRYSKGMTATCRRGVGFMQGTTSSLLNSCLTYLHLLQVVFVHVFWPQSHLEFCSCSTSMSWHLSFPLYRRSSAVNSMQMWDPCQRVHIACLDDCHVRGQPRGLCTSKGQLFPPDLSRLSTKTHSLRITERSTDSGSWRTPDGSYAMQAMQKTGRSMHSPTDCSGTARHRKKINPWHGCFLHRN